MTAEATLSHAAARAVYDRIGAWQDTQRFYEDGATSEMIAHAQLGSARAVFEFGAGTGRLAERLLRAELPRTATYHGIDVSTTMVGLARERLRPWHDRARIAQTEGSPRIDAAAGCVDRFVSTYVLDLLSAADITLVLDEAHRVLSADGLVCLVSATHGRAPLERLVMRIAGAAHSLSPALVGGCRAIDLRGFLGPTRWRLVHRSVVSKWGIPSEIVVARPA